MEAMTWAGEELIGFGASFDGARFAPSGAVGDFGGGDGGQEMAQAAESLAGGGGAPDDPGPGLQTIDGAFEAGACGVASTTGDEAAQDEFPGGITEFASPIGAADTGQFVPTLSCHPPCEWRVWRWFELLMPCFASIEVGCPLAERAVRRFV